MVELLITWGFITFPWLQQNELFVKKAFGEVFSRVGKVAAFFARIPTLFYGTFAGIYGTLQNYGHSA